MIKLWTKNYSEWKFSSSLFLIKLKDGLIVLKSYCLLDCFLFNKLLLKYFDGQNDHLEQKNQH